MSTSRIPVTARHGISGWRSRHAGGTFLTPSPMSSMRRNTASWTVSRRENRLWKVPPGTFARAVRSPGHLRAMHSDAWSQDGHLLAQDLVLDAWIQRAVGDGLHVAAEQITQLQFERSDVQETRRAGELDKNVYVAPLARRIAGKRPEKPRARDPMGAQHGGDLLDLRGSEHIRRHGILPTDTRTNCLQSVHVPV